LRLSAYIIKETSENAYKRRTTSFNVTPFQDTRPTMKVLLILAASAVFVGKTLLQ